MNENFSGSSPDNYTENNAAIPVMPSLSDEDIQVLKKRQKRADKKTFSLLGWCLLLYFAVSTAVVFADIFLRYFIYNFTYALGYESDFLYSLVSNADESYWSTILGVMLGFLIIFLITKNRLPFSKYTEKNSKMTPVLFIVFVSFMASGQMLFTLFDIGLESFLNVFGYTAISSVESATADASNLSMLVYSAICAPVFEELVYRGFCLRMSERFGKKFAVVFSAVLFGVMHANLPQGFFAFYLGLILGFVAVNYSIYWSIALHFFNNAIFGEVLSLLTENMDAVTQTLIFYFLMGTLTLSAFIALIACRNSLNLFVKSNPTYKGAWRMALTSLPILLFMALNIFIAITSLEAIY